MKKIHGKDRWQLLVKRTLSYERRNIRVLSNDWQGFNKLEIDLLLQLEDEQITFDSIKEQSHLTQILQNGAPNFLEQCLYTTLGKNKRMLEDKFLPLFSHIDELVAIR